MFLRDGSASSDVSKDTARVPILSDEECTDVLTSPEAHEASLESLTTVDLSPLLELSGFCSARVVCSRTGTELQSIVAPQNSQDIDLSLLSSIHQFGQYSTFENLTISTSDHHVIVVPSEVVPYCMYVLALHKHAGNIVIAGKRLRSVVL